MKIRRFGALAAAVLTASFSLCACGDKESSDGSNSGTSAAESSSISAGNESFDPEAKPKSGAAPVLSISNAEGRPGETVEITVSISGADKKWSSCGIHIIYDNELQCVTEPDPADPEKVLPVYEKGEAIAYIPAFVSVVWTDDLIEELEANNKHSLFFTTMATGDFGLDGDIVTYQLTIPENAEVGKKYAIEFFYRDGDLFGDASGDSAIEDYAFTHWINGSITVV